MFFLMQIIFIVLPSDMAAVQNLYRTFSNVCPTFAGGPKVT